MKVPSPRRPPSHSPPPLRAVSPPLRAVPPPLPPLRSVPPPPVVAILQGPPIEVEVPPDSVEHPTTNDYRGALVPQSSVVRLMRLVGEAGAETKAIVVRLFERVRTVQSYRDAVALDRVARAPLFTEARLNKAVVSTYKLVGFAVLTAIVLALVSYLGQNVFFWFSSSWIEPTVIAPTDDRVIALSAQLAQQAGARDKVAADLADAERVVKMQEDYLGNARQALAEELADRKSELTRLLALDRSFGATRAEVASNGRAYTHLSRQRLAAEYGAHLIDRETAVTGAMQLSQIAEGNLSMAEKEIELSKRRAELSRETDALAAVVSGQKQSRHSLEVLRILQEVKRAEIELARARDNRDVLQKSLGRYDKMVRTLSQSAYLRAVDGKDTIAFVPYDNLSHATAGAPLYGCWLGPLFCRKVGAVVAVLPGEQSFKHPMRSTEVRGQSVQVQLDDVRDAERKVLFAGGRPLLF